MDGTYWLEIDGLRLPRPCGGHPALDFINTYAGWGEKRRGPGSGGGDYLETYGHLAAWVGLAGLLDRPTASALRRRAAARPSEAAAILTDARQLRSDLHQAILRPNSPRAMAAVSRFAERAASQAFLEPGTFGREPRWAVGGRLERPLLAVAWSAAELLTQADLTAIHPCPGKDCGWMFLDPRGRRKWCSMQWCGNRSKVHAHAERQRAAV